VEPIPSGAPIIFIEFFFKTLKPPEGGYYDVVFSTVFLLKLPFLRCVTDGAVATLIIESLRRSSSYRKRTR